MKLKTFIHLFLFIFVSISLASCGALSSLGLSGEEPVPPPEIIDPTPVEQPNLPDATATVGLVMQTPTEPAPTATPSQKKIIWTVNQMDHTVLALNPGSLDAVAVIATSGQPGGIVEGNGSVWVIDEDNDFVVRIDAESHEAIATIPILGFDLKTIAFGEGDVWVGVQEKEEGAASEATTLTGGVVRINGETGEIVKYISTNAPVVDVAFAGGKAWTVSASANFSTINQIDLQTNIPASYGDYTIWYERTRIAANSRGLWLINTATPEKLHLLDPATSELISSSDIGKVPGTPYDVVANEVAVWILFDNGTVARFDPTRMEVFSIIPVSQYAKEIFATSGGVWAVSQSDATIYQIDEAQNRVVASGITGSAFPTPTATPRSTKAAYEACEADYLTRLYVNGRAKVSEYPPENNRVRAEPNKDADIIGYISPGEEMDITEGPVCANNWVWWRIRSATGVVGWTAEGNKNTYWLVPIE